MDSKNKKRTTVNTSPELYKRFHVAVIQMEPRLSMSKVLEVLIDNFLRNEYMRMAFLENQENEDIHSANKKPEPLRIPPELHKEFHVAVVQMSVSMSEVVEFLVKDFLRNESSTARFLRSQEIDVPNSTGEEE